jgi:predicted nucleic acid-binding protein
MILVDTSIWIDHFRVGNVRLSELLESGRVYSHPFVICELALGNLQNRTFILDLLERLPQATSATTAEVMYFIEQYQIAGTGIGYVDASLLASAKLSDLRLWTFDKKLLSATEKIKQQGLVL